MRDRPRRPWTLRRRLVVAVVALLLGTAAALAVSSLVALRASLVDQVDAQLLAASERSEREPGDGPPGEAPEVEEETPGPPFLEAAGQRTGTVGMLVRDGVVALAGYLDQDALVQPLDAGQRSALLEGAAGSEPQTVVLEGIGSVRVRAVQLEPGTVLVTGLSLADAEATLGRAAVTGAVIAAAAGVVAALVAAVLVRRALRPLDRVAATASRVTELPLDRGEVAIAERVDPADTDPRTEVGQVGAALNGLLGHVESALAARYDSETQVRQFVADASHELRTPVASIRGYAELVRRSPEEVPESTRRAVQRVESEAIRMGDLVDDLLLLARLDAGRPLAREAVDLAGLAVDAVTDAHAAGPRHEWRLDVPEEGAVVVGDSQRLHQVLANLLANARVHTPPGTRVDVRVRSVPDGVRVEVHDDGPGVPEALLPVLFQRFSRGDEARSRAGGSTGLGLAIADAVVRAHGGRIEVTSRPGATTFAVWLPAGGPAKA